MREYLKVLHPFKSLLISLGVVLGFFITTQKFAFNLTLLYGIISIFSISSGGFFLNDYARIGKDRIENPEKPLPSGEINKKAVMSLSGGLFSIGIIFSYLINFKCFLMGVIGVSLLTLYELGMKRSVPLFDNILIGFLLGFTVLFGGFIAGSYKLAGSLGMILSLILVGREITTDIEESNRLGTERVSLPSILGAKFAGWTAGAFLTTAAILTPIPYLLGFLGRNYLFIASITDILLLYASFKIINSPKSARESQIIERIAIFFLSVSFLTVLV